MGHLPFSVARPRLPNDDICCLMVASGEEVWWNIIHTGSLKAGDGTPFPKKMVQEIQKNGWEHTYAFKLRPGACLTVNVCARARARRVGMRRVVDMLAIASARATRDAML